MDQQPIQYRSDESAQQKMCQVHPFMVEIFEKVDKRTESIPAIQVNVEHIIESLRKMDRILFDPEKGNLIDRVNRLEEDNARLRKLEERIAPLEADHENLVKIQKRISRVFWGVCIPLLLSAILGGVTFIYNIYVHLMGIK